MNGEFPAVESSKLSQDGSAILKELERRHAERLKSLITRERTLVDQWVAAAPPQSRAPSDSSYSDLRQEADKNKKLSDELLLSTSEENRRAADKILVDLRDSIQRLDAIVADLTQKAQEDKR